MRVLLFAEETGRYTGFKKSPNGHVHSPHCLKNYKIPLEKKMEQQLTKSTADPKIWIDFTLKKILKIVATTDKIDS